MKSVLFFNVDGILEQRKTNIEIFDIKDFPDFNAVKKYPEYLVLYRTLSTQNNKVKLPFTDDTFNGEILLIKHSNEKLETLTASKFIKIITKKNKLKYSEYLSDSSDSDPLEESCNLSGSSC